MHTKNLVLYHKIQHCEWQCHPLLILSYNESTRNFDNSWFLIEPKGFKSTNNLRMVTTYPRETSADLCILWKHTFFSVLNILKM